MELEDSSEDDDGVDIELESKSKEKKTASKRNRLTMSSQDSQHKRSKVSLSNSAARSFTPPPETQVILCCFAFIDSLIDSLIHGGPHDHSCIVRK